MNLHSTLLWLSRIPPGNLQPCSCKWHTLTGPPAGWLLMKFTASLLCEEGRKGGM